MSDGEVDGEDVYRAVLRLAFRDGSVEGEEMDWLRRMAGLLEIPKDDRKRIQADIRYESKMGRLAKGDDEPSDVFRKVCTKGWKNAQLGAAELEAIEDLARAFGLDRARAEGILAGTAPAGATVPDLENIDGAGRAEPTPPAPSSHAATAEKPLNAAPPEEGGGFPVVEALVVTAVLAGVAGMLVL